ncbi:hypothetical protein [Methylophaga sp.]|uniref:hypothetical protein n=1 Tax=Methylophaga sp. TaxID=2024840 RepID=UPI003A95637F
MTQEEEMQMSLRQELFSLINREFAGENDRVAYVLKSLGKPVSVRTIQAWLIDPRRQSSRKVPEWVIPTLRSHLEGLKENPYSTPAERESALARFIDIHDKGALESAEREIARDSHIYEKWAEASTVKLAEMLAELELAMLRQADDMNNFTDSLLQAMNESDDFEGFKAKLKTNQDFRFRARYVIRKTRQDIENRSGEFSNDEGLTD